MRIVIDIDNTTFTNKSIVYKLLNERTNNRAKKQKNLKFYAADKKPAKLLKINRLLPFVNPKKFVEVTGAINVINKLYKSHEIFFVSSRPAVAPLIESTKELLQNNKVNYHVLVLACKNKAEFCKQFGVDVAIDDFYEHCKNIADVGTTAFCLNPTPHENKNIYNVTSWKQIYTTILLNPKLEKQNKTYPLFDKVQPTILDYSAYTAGLTKKQ